MSVGVAILGGLVGRLNQKVQQEEAIELAKAKASKNADPSLMRKSFQSMLESGKIDELKQLSNVFSDAFTLDGDMTGLNALNNVVNSVNSGNITYGDGLINFAGSNKSGFDRAEETLYNTQAYFSQMANKGKLAELRKSPEAYQAFVTDTKTALLNWIPGWIKSNSQDELVANVPIASEFWEGVVGIDEDFRKDLSKALSGTADGVNNVHTGFAANYLAPDNKETPLMLKAKSLDGKSEKVIPLSLDQSQSNLLTKIATTMGVSTQALLDNYPSVSFSKLRGASTQEEIVKAYNPLFGAFDIAPFNPERFDPQFKVEGVLGLGGDVTDEDAAAIFDVLEKRFVEGDTQDKLLDVEGMIGAVLPHMNYGISKSNPATPGQLIESQNLATYLKRRLGIDVTNISGEKGVVKTGEAAEKTLVRIQELIAENGVVGASEGISRVVGGTLGSKGFISQIAKSIGIFENKEKGVSDGSGSDFLSGRLQAEIDRAYEQDRENAKNNFQTNLGEVAALRVVAAFQMARAVDPSGRLSNMDVEIQLARLGGTAAFQDLDYAEAQIGVAIRDVQNRNRFYRSIERLFTGEEQNLSPALEARADAVIAVDQIIRKASRHEVADKYGKLTGAYDYVQTGEVFKTNTEGDTVISPSDTSNIQAQDDGSSITIGGKTYNIAAGQTVPSIYGLIETTPDGKLSINGKIYPGEFQYNDNNSFTLK